MLEVLEAGGLGTLQDVGRPGWRRFGVPLAGPMDRFAFHAANALLGNPLGAVALELGLGDFEFRASQDCLIAVTGAGYQLSVHAWDFPLWGSCFVRGGWSVRLARRGFGMWGYLAVAGGFDCPAVLGSRSTYLRGHFGGLAGRPLQPGDILRASAASRSMMEVAARTLPEALRPAYGPWPILDVLPGPQFDRFTADDVEAFLSGEYRVSASSDRMGYRLDGPPLFVSQPDITSEGLAIGSIQVPAGGQPIAMMADSATTGGYPKIACVASAVLPLLAQCTPGQDAVRFRQATIESAQSAYRSLMEGLKQGIIDADEWQSGYG